MVIVYWIVSLAIIAVYCEQVLAELGIIVQVCPILRLIDYITGICLDGGVSNLD